MNKLHEKREEIDAKRKALADIFQAHPTMDMSADVVEDIRRRNDELTDLGKSYDVLRDASEIADRNQKAMADDRRPVAPVPFQGGPDAAHAPVQQKSIGRRYVEHDGYRRAVKRGNPQFSVDLDDVEFKTTMTEAAGFAPPNYRTDIVIPSAQRRLVVADLIPQTTTQAQIILYMRETTFTNNAAATLEGATKPESALAFTQISSPVQKVANTIPVTEEQLDDVPQIEALINDRLSLMVLLAEEVELLSGSGTAPHLTGIYNTAGINSQPKATDPTPDACYKAMTLVRQTVGFADPSAWVFHPTDWQNIKLLRTSTGEYIWGNPADMGPERLWGLPIVQTIAATLGTGLTGDFRMYAHISRRMGLRIDAGYINDDFTKNLLRIRAEERLSFEVYRPSAFALVTGL